MIRLCPYSDYILFAKTMYRSNIKHPPLSALQVLILLLNITLLLDFGCFVLWSENLEKTCLSVLHVAK